MRNDDFPNLSARIPGLDAKQAIEALGGSAELYQRLLLQIFRLTPTNIREMDEAIGAEDLAAFAVKTHGVRGALYQAGFARLAGSAEGLEKSAKAGDLTYCRERYGSFRGDLLSLYEQLRAAFNPAGKETETASGSNAPGDTDDINAYLDALSGVKRAIEDYDSLKAAELLEPLTVKRFGDDVDTLIAGIMEELELFRPEAAMRNIKELYDLCTPHSLNHGQRL